ncbi:MAG: hypothetical protein ACXW1Q_02530 [Halobacteriota archaeon]
MPRSGVVVELIFICSSFSGRQKDQGTGEASGQTNSSFIPDKFLIVATAMCVPISDGYNL